jgi:hypothetical protein
MYSVSVKQIPLQFACTLMELRAVIPSLDVSQCVTKNFAVGGVCFVN